MMDHERQEKEIQEVFEATCQSYQAAMENVFALQEQTFELARNLLESSTESVRKGAESNRETLEALVEQSRRQQEALQDLVRGSAEAFAEVLQTPFSHHHHIGEDVPTPGAKEGRSPGPRFT